MQCSLVLVKQLITSSLTELFILTCQFAEMVCLRLDATFILGARLNIFGRERAARKLRKKKVRLGSFRASRTHRTESVAAKFSDIDAGTKKLASTGSHPAWTSSAGGSPFCPNFTGDGLSCSQFVFGHVTGWRRGAVARALGEGELAGLVRNLGWSKEKNGCADKLQPSSQFKLSTLYD